MSRYLPPMRKAVISVSGGMDSTALLLRMLAEGYFVEVINFNYGQKHGLERQRLQKNISLLHRKKQPVFYRELTIPTLTGSALTDPEIEVPKGFYEEDNMKATVVPNRNAIFMAFLYSRALDIANESDSNVDIALGIHSGDHAIYPDCREEFVDAIMQAFAKGNWNSHRVGVRTPFIEMDKARILKGALTNCEALGLDFDEVFANTLTSYDPDEQGRSNGKTGSDVERILAFHEIGRKDPVEYVDGWEVALANAIQAQEDFEKQKGVPA